MLGEIRTGKITDSNAEAYFVQIDGLTFKLKKEEITQEETPEIAGKSRDLFMITKNMNGK